MKLSILFVAILGVATASALPAGKVHSVASKSLSDDFADFLALVPVDQVLEIALRYLAEDSEVQAAVAYIQSDEFKSLVNDVNAIPEYRAFLNYLDNAGLDVYKWINWLHGILDIPEVSPSSLTRNARNTGGIKGLWAEIKAVLPIDEIKALYHEKLETSEDFVALIVVLNSDKAKTLYAELKANPEYQAIRAKLESVGIDVSGVLDIIKSIIGYERTYSVLATKSLSDDWADFYALIDSNAIVEIVIQYLAEDEEVQNLVAYVLSDNFKALVLAVEAIPEYIAFLDYLDAAGLNVYYYVNIIHGILGLDELSSTFSVNRVSPSARITGGIAGLWADLKATLPLAELRALFEEKLQTSEDFANLIALLSSEKAQVIYDALKANEEYQYIRAALIENGLDIDRFFDWLKALIGWA